MIPERHAHAALPAPHFAIVAPLQWREIDGQWVVFRSDPPGLCEVDAFGAAVLNIIEEGPGTAPQVAGTLSRLTECAYTDELVQQVTEHLRWLASVGLVEHALP
ncbi:MAG: hypothetical protein A3E25_10690 [Burkholderiales bacterium RIFCSPHIGHO2_12_FULL_69_20]|nr:MAG: hypothetical protein A3E25_10690 [Burkholderiales bacterium RIFCSPHIGHO2_12_FULL_69_20]